MNKFVIVNGKIVEKEEVNLTHLFTGDPFILSQKIWFGFGGIPLFNKNMDAINSQIEALQLPYPGLLSNRRELFRITKRMLNKNKFYRSGWIEIRLLWNDEQVNSIISSRAFPEFDFPFFNNGILINYSEFKKESSNSFTRFPFYSANRWEIIDIQLRSSQFQNSILLNEKNAVCECVNANLFFVKGNMLITPSLETGCFEDSLRAIILEIASLLKFKIVELENIRKDDVSNMDEIFLAGESHGIQWILGVERKRFVHEISKQIHKRLNRYLQKLVEDE
ncbi:MAG: aminotransferase class IV [Prolixibacteraceae bacterium]|nr:aminotransferase class IV [Prolixibacteraceae bacterium]